MMGMSAVLTASETDRLDDYLSVLAVERGLRPNTVAAYRRDLRQYLLFVEEHHQGVPTPTVVDAYLFGLHEREMRASTVARKLAAVRGYHRFLVDEGHSPDDPTRLAETPRLAMALPKALDVEEAIRLVESPSVDDVLGRRDRALLEVLYGAGVRVSEAVDLESLAVDLKTKTAMVSGKGGKQRLVPLGNPAVAAVESYQPDRMELRRPGADPGTLFLSYRGRRLTRQAVFQLVRKYAAQAGIPDEKVSPHVLRHSAATHMVEGGADLRTVQEILGHASISTTQVYTKMSLQHLHEVYVGAHPRALPLNRK